ncbi:MAG TPA: RNA polymerase sigma factor [Acidimicrobiales bacterium]|nr:RNA polymerase sigma factor [Acidimicrobiales bacterium]
MGPAAHAAPRDPLTASSPARLAAGARWGGETPEALVDAARAGDRSAFEELVRATYADTYALAFRMTGDEEDASDVLQEAYLRAYRGLRRFRGDAAFSTWLYRITANCASTHVTRRGRTRTSVLSPDAVVPDDRPEHDPEARASVNSDRARVAAAVADLPPRLRAVVVLRDVYDLPHEAIAAELGISETAAKVRLHRARKRLRERLFPLRGESADGSDP